jgi:glycosyl transferase, family 25
MIDPVTAAPPEFPPIYYINLARSADRRARMERQLASWPGAVQRVEGVDGRRLGRLELLNRQVPVRTLLRHGRLLKPGEVGTFLAHQGVYRRLLASGADAAIVLEDDVTIELPALQALLPAIRSLTFPWDVILLHNHSDLHPDKPYFAPLKALSDRFTLMGLLDEPCSAGAYLITRRGAGKMLKIRRFDSPADYWAWWGMRTGLQVFALDPVLARADRQFASDIDAVALRKPEKGKRISWLFRRSRKAFRSKVRKHCRESLQRLGQTS